MNDSSQASQLNQRVEREIRFLIGELTVQAIVLRQMLELSQPQEQPNKPQPNPTPQPHPPGKPGPSPDIPPPNPNRSPVPDPAREHMNGREK
jgi:hypothetical protein